MTNLVKSARGEIVDFDLLRIKHQISAAPTAVNVQARQSFIDNKLKRRTKKQVQAVIESESPIVGASSSIEEIKNPTKKEKK